MDASAFWSGINAEFSNVAVLAIIGLFGWISQQLVTFLQAHGGAAKAQVEQDALAKAKDTLHQALTTGVTMALANDPNANPVAVIRAAIAYAYKSSPDALSLLQPAGDVLVSIAVAKIRDVIPAKWQDFLGANPTAVSQAVAAVTAPPAA